MRLIDRIISTFGRDCLRRPELMLADPAGHAAEVPGDPFEEAVHFRIQNVADYFFSTSQQEWPPGGPELYEQFPIMRSPWPTVYCEWRDLARGTDFGAFVLTRELTQIEKGLIAAPVRWQATEVLFSRAHSRFLVFAQTLFLGQEGQWLWIPANCPLALARTPWLKEDPGFPGLATAPLIPVTTIPAGIMGRVNPALFTISSIPLWLAFSFCHCRNVRVLTQTVPEKLNRRYEKKGGPRVDHWYGLEISQMQRTLDQTMRDAGTRSLARCLHICRGNFARYKSEHPLFGKYVGLFWRPMHVRGNKSRGVVHKDYSVGEQPIEKKK